MYRFLKGFLGKTQSQPTPAVWQAPTEVVVEGMPPLVLPQYLGWYCDLPVPDWPAIHLWLDMATDESMKNAAYIACVRAWLLHFCKALGANYYLLESEQAMVLSSAKPDIVQVTLSYMERTLKRISYMLDGLAKVPSHGKSILILFDDLDDYYRYVSYYYPEDGKFALSGGIHINAQCSHFVTVENDLPLIEPIIVHEMTHACLSHLPLPAWIYEGLAVIVEQELAGRKFASWTPQEMREKHMFFWGKSEIQEFWSGSSFQRTDDGNLLSYDLARILVEQLGQNWDQFRQFALVADQRDGGAHAARKFFGVSLGALVASLFQKDDTEAFEPLKAGRIVVN